MQARTRWWLLAVLALVVASLLGVLEPIKFRYRRDPDTGRPVKPAKAFGRVYLYKPHLGLTLGLDLRGGMHLMLQAQDEGIFRFTTPELSQVMSEDRQVELHGQVVDALPLEQVGTKKLNVTVQPDKGQVEIVTRVANQADMRRQNAKMLELLKTTFPQVKEAQPPQYNGVTRETLTQMQSILENRVNAVGVAEPVIQALPDQKRILVELPGVKDVKVAQQMVQETAQLEFRLIPRKYGYADHGPNFDAATKTWTFTDVANPNTPVPEEKVLAESPVELTGRELKPGSSEVLTAVGQKTQVAFEFQGAARKKLEDFTRGHVKYYMAIVLDKKLYMAPIIEAVLPGRGVIEGGTFDGPEGLTKANELKILLNAGALPFDLEYVENRTVSPELGAGHLQTALYAGFLGLLVVLVFMVAYYRLPGLLADGALIIYIVLLMGTIKLVNQVLTLPGILAVIISIGMAVDANIIIFERLKEEIRTGKTLRSAVEAAFKRAWTAILDSNVCSMGTGAVLFFFGTGPIKGFAVALVLGVAVSLFTAVTVTRLFMSMIVETRMGQNPRMYGVSPDEIG